MRRATGKLPGQHGQLPISIHALLAESDGRRERCNIFVLNFYPRSPCGERLAAHSPTPRAAINFYPRSPCGERHNNHGREKPLWSISIHALLAESDRLAVCMCAISLNFYPRSPCGERRLPTALRTPHHKFLSTLSLRRATELLPKRLGNTLISIHALLAESDKRRYTP